MGPQQAGYRLDQCRLAGAVGADKRDDLAGTDRQVDIVNDAACRRSPSRFREARASGRRLLLADIGFDHARILPDFLRASRGDEVPASSTMT